MAQLDFYCSIQDRTSILESIFRGASVNIIWDGWYQSDKVPLFKVVSRNFLALLEEKRSCFLVSEDAAAKACSGLVQQTLGERAGQYWVDVDRLPSGLALTLPACFDERGRTWLSSGSLYCPREVFNHSRSRWESAEVARRELFTTCKSILQKNLLKVSAYEKVHRIGPHALELVREGRATILYGKANQE